MLEVAAAAGLALPAIAPLAGAGLVLLLIAMFPANIKGAVEHLPLRGKPTTPLLFRLPLQILFIAVHDHALPQEDRGVVRIETCLD
ncbi:MAG TPA: hypothetical protein VFG86_16320 [Chloroflexota bacterium]|nr:hypothetical protein [Chloroflexota bacterium]